MANLSSEIKEYSPYDRFTLPFWKTWGVIFRNIRDSRDLIWFLFLRDLFANYRRSFLGSSWVVISPLLNTLAWVFLNQTGFIDPGELEVPYIVYVLVGTSIWRFFISVYTDASNTLLSSKNIIAQVSYPHEVIFVQKILITLAEFGVTFVINIIVILLFGVGLSWEALYFPLVLIPLLLFGSALGLLVALLGVVIDDFKTVFNFFINMMMWITPVVYSAKLKSALVQAIIPWNPLTYLISSARDIVITGQLYETGSFLIVSGLSLVFFLIALRLFWVSENRLVERLI
jgi:lipopolysaccharide transport system permease protein